MWTTLIETGVLVDWCVRAFRILIVLLIALAVLRSLCRWTERARLQWLSAQMRMRRLRKAGAAVDACEELEKRSLTIAHSVRHALVILVSFVALVAIVGQLGIETNALLGFAGIVSIAVGLGARSLIQDVISGLLILSDNQIREGDLVRIRDITGVVEEINLRRLRLRGADGAVHLIANGSIREVANLSFLFSCYVWDFRIAYHEDVETVIGVLTEIGRELRSTPEHAADILEDLEIFGVDGFGPHGATIKMRIKTKPRRQAVVGRAMNRQINKRFEELGMAFPLPARRLYPIAGGLLDNRGLPGGRRREALKAEIHHVLAGMGGLPADLT